MVLSGISPSFDGLSQSQRQVTSRVTHPCAALLVELPPLSPHDLHVLGTPPAFVLSQDQTLHSAAPFVGTADWHYHLVFKDRPHSGGNGLYRKRTSTESTPFGRFSRGPKIDRHNPPGSHLYHRLLTREHEVWVFDPLAVYPHCSLLDQAPRLAHRADDPRRRHNARQRSGQHPAVDRH